MKAAWKLSWFVFLAVLAAARSAEAASPQMRGTHVTVNSRDLEGTPEEELEPSEQKFRFYGDDRVTVDLNDDGNPNFRMNF